MDCERYGQIVAAPARGGRRVGGGLSGLLSLEGLRRPQDFLASNETWALTIRQPFKVRTHVWLCRPTRVSPTRWNSVFTVAKSCPKLVMTVLAKVRSGDPPARAVRNAAIAS